MGGPVTGYRQTSARSLRTLDIPGKVARSLRPEELPEEAYDDIWDGVNTHLGTSARRYRNLLNNLER